MRYPRRLILPLILVLLAALTAPAWPAPDVVRPEEIRSMREVIYDTDTYAELAGLWHEYYDAFPSEQAYANWMYAARYARDPNYEELLRAGADLYPANPTLLYLKSMLRHGAHGNTEAKRLLERAVELDPNYTEPWFSLVIHYMDERDDERLDVALRHILETGAIDDVVMDYNYNVLLGLEENAILITNGDNDTYPAWVLTRILGFRPDVTIVNRSLLNADWYPLYVIEHGLPRFITASELETLRTEIFRNNPDLASRQTAAGPFGDTLILRLTAAAGRAGRPVYFSQTLYITDQLQDAVAKGRDLGLATLVTPSARAYSDQVTAVYKQWTDGFRTAGLQSWRLRHGTAADAGRRLAVNYADALAEALRMQADLVRPQRQAMFRWYTENVEALLADDSRYEYAVDWCAHAADIPEVKAWGKAQGLECTDAR